MQIHRGGGRFVTSTPGLTSRHSFSFGPHYDPGNTHHGLLLVHNEDTMAPGSGYQTHRHKDTEILTWVVGGSLVHTDSAGHTAIVEAGMIQRLSAGRGIEHSETNEPRRLGGGQGSQASVHYIQMWVPPDQAGIDPGYQLRRVDDDLAGGELVPIASGMPRHRPVCPVVVHNAGAALYAARLGADGVVVLPEAPFLHLFVAKGAIAVERAGRLNAGDAVRFTDSGGQRVTALLSAQILLWQMDADHAHS